MSDSPYFFHDRRSLVPEEVPGPTSISDSGDGFVFTLLPETQIDGAVEEDNDFVTEWEGTLHYEFDQTLFHEIWLLTTHRYGSTVFTIRRLVEGARVQGGTDRVFRLSNMNTRTRVSVGTTAIGDRTITITEADLLGPTDITYALEFLTYSRRGDDVRLQSNISDVSITAGKVVSFQLRGPDEDTGGGSGDSAGGFEFLDQYAGTAAAASEIYGRTPSQAWARNKRTLWKDRYWFRTLVTPPDTTLPVTVQQVRDRLRLNADEPEADIELMIRSAVAWWEEETDTALMPQTWRMHWDWFPADGGMVPIFISPVRDVTSVTYLSDDGEVTLSDSTYEAIIDGYGSAFLVRTGDRRNWPARRTPNHYRPDGLRITVSAGYADAASIPADISDALLLWTGMRYRFREAVTDMDVRVLPWGLRSVVNRYTEDLGERTSMTVAA